MARKAGVDTAPSDSIMHPLQPERCLQIIVNTQAKLSLKVQVSEVAHRTTRNLQFPHNFEKCCNHTHLFETAVDNRCQSFPKFVYGLARYGPTFTTATISRVLGVARHGDAKFSVVK